MNDNVTAGPTETDFACSRWEPCAGFVPEVTASQICGDCGWLDDDHAGEAVVRRLPTPRPRAAVPRRLAS
jgi:hypothetical protein